MDPSDAVTALVSVVGGAGSALGVVKWSLARNIEGKDADDRARDAALAAAQRELQDLRERFARLDPRLENFAREQGRNENELGRISGKIEGLQADWRSKFETLQREIDRKHERLMEMLAETRAENAKIASDLRLFLEQYRKDFHDRFTAIIQQFYAMRAEIIEEVVLRIGEKT